MPRILPWQHFLPSPRYPAYSSKHTNIAISAVNNCSQLLYSSFTTEINTAADMYTDMKV